MIGYEVDKKETDKYLTKIKRILGQLLIREGTVKQDQTQNTDLLMPGARIGCRVRDESFMELYGDEFTIRVERPDEHTLTEIHKLIMGYGDYLFYGFVDGKDIIHWNLLNMRYFVLGLFEMSEKQKIPKPKTHPDGSALFIGFKYKSFHDNLVVCRWDKNKGVLK